MNHLSKTFCRCCFSRMIKRRPIRPVLWGEATNTLYHPAWCLANSKKQEIVNNEIKTSFPTSEQLPWAQKLLKHWFIQRLLQCWFRQTVPFSSVSLNSIELFYEESQKHKHFTAETEQDPASLPSTSPSDVPDSCLWDKLYLPGIPEFQT